MSEDEKNEGAKLLHNLGTDTREVQQGRTNMRRFTVIDAGDKALLNYGDFRTPNSNFWRTFVRNELDYNCAVGGRARRDAINGTQVERGASVDMKPEKPGPIDGLLHPDKKKAYEDWKRENEVE